MLYIYIYDISRLRVKSVPFSQIVYLITRTKTCKKNWNLIADNVANQIFRSEILPFQ